VECFQRPMIISLLLVNLSMMTLPFRPA